MKSGHAFAPSLILLAALAAHGASWAFDAPVSRHAKVTGAAKGAPPMPVEDVDMLQRLRERLAEKLGAKPADARGAQLVRVVSKPSVQASAPPVVSKPRPVTPSAPKPPHAEGASHWGYSGELGPKAWGGLRPEFVKCANGTRQSPIDIRDGIAVDLEPVQFDYRASGFRVIDNGHTVQVNVDPGNSIVSRGQRFDLVQFHFHRPAEERIDGRAFDMDVHLVHQDAQGRLAVVAVLLERGSAQPLVQTVWNNLPLEKGEEASSRAVLDLNHLLPPDRGYYTYMGSLTTPPCSEGVQWVVMRQPVSISPEQIEIFARLYPMNARPVQQAAGRMIKQSN